MKLSEEEESKMERKYQPCWESLKADTVRLGRGEYSFVKFLISAFIDPNFRAIITMRLCQRLSMSHRPARAFLLLARVLHGFAQRYAGIELSWRALIGPGFRITHGWGLVINSGARIGSNVTVFHGVTLGQKSTRLGPNEWQIQYPTVEDKVWIGPHAIVLGGVTIGRGARIAGGCVVTHDVEPFSIVAGNPMQLLRKNAEPDVPHPANVNSLVNV